jgi:CDP-diacylglycerol--serine O-phosphatidyltransferase
MAHTPKFTLSGSTPKLDKRYFVGLPIPPAAGILAAVVHFSPTPLAVYTPESQQILSWALLVGMGLLSLLMVSNLRYSSFKDIGFHTNKPFIALPFFSLILALIWFHSQIMLLVIAVAYVLHGPLFKVWALLNRMRRPLTKGEDNVEQSEELVEQLKS